MQKYFVIADVHSYYWNLMYSLECAEFDLDNPEHILVSCGDLFDRGSESKECLDFVMSIPKERRIFIMGNHEQNLIELLDETRPVDESDKHNGTLKTLRDLSDTKSTKIENIINGARQNKNLNEYLSELRDYYKTEHFLFVHGWYPWEVIDKDGTETIQINYKDKNKWWRARWMCGFSEWYSIRRILDTYPDVKFLNEPVTVCGHWHTSYGHSRYRGVGEEFPDKGKKWREHCCFYPYFDEKIIALDACTALTHRCNWVILEEPSGKLIDYYYTQKDRCHDPNLYRRFKKDYNTSF